MSKSNLKKALLETQEQNKKEYFQRRITIYDKILNRLAYIESNLDNKTALEESELKKIWLEKYHYCSSEVNNELNYFLRYYNEKPKETKKIIIKEIREQIKIDIDEYYDF